jgi:hypothetical protein
MNAFVDRVRVAVGTSILVALMATCDKEPAAPKQAQVPPTAATQAVIDEKLSVEVGDEVDDVLTRVLPALGDAQSVASLRSSLGALRAALASRDIALIVTARTSLAASVNAFATGDRDSVKPDIAVVRLLLDQVDAVAANPPTHD